MKHTTARPGFIMLVTSLAIGTVAVASALAIITLGLSIERNAFAIQVSSQAMAGAWSCAEHALYQVQQSIGYSGNEELDIVTEGGTQKCKIYPLSGDGNFNRVLCTEATYGNYTQRRLYIKISRVWPTTLIKSWKEVSEFPSDCGTYTGEDALCGNGTLNGAETCDDGNNRSNDGCSSVCLLESCGDSIIQAGEGCDDGKYCSNGTKCNSASDCGGNPCVTVSSDGRNCVGGTNPGTTCTSSAQCLGGGLCGAACSATCLVEACGDSIIQGQCSDTSAACDDNTDCASGACIGEICDDGTDCSDGTCNNNGPTHACTAFCRDRKCGDSIVQPALGEQCDNGGLCSNDNAPCSDDRNCTAGICQPQAGDGCNATCQNEAPAETAPATAPLLYWKFDNNVNNSGSAGASYNGTLRNGPTYDSGADNKAPISATNTHALRFDGDNDYVQGPTDDDLFPEEFSVSFWVKNDTDSSFITSNSSWGDTGILCKSDDGQEDGWGFYFKPYNPSGSTFNYWDSTRRIHFFVEGWDSNVASVVIPSGTETSWHHVVGVYDRPDVYIYLDGVLSSDDESYSGSRDDDEQLDAGRCEDNDQNLNGWLDDVRFYNYELTPSNVLYLKNNGA